MGTHQFDKQIKDKLQFHQSEVDPILWDKIESHLPKKNNNRFLPIFWIASGVIFLTVLSLGIYTKQTQNTASEQKSVIALTASDHIAFIQKHNNVNKKVASENNVVNEPAHKKTISENIGGNEKQNLSLKNKNNFESSVSTTILGKTITSDETQRQNDIEISDRRKSMEEVGNMDTHIKPVFMSEFNSMYSPDSKKFTNKDHCLEDFSTKGRGMILEAFYGNDFPIRHMKAKTESFASLVNERKNTETPLYSYSLGARLGFNISDELKIYTGAYYSQLNEKFEYVDPESSQTKVVKTTLYIKDGQGNIKDSTFTFDTIYIPGTLIYKIKNQYSTVDLPFLVGFHAIKGSKVDVHVNVGILANLVFQKSGMALVNENYSVRSFKDTDGNTFNNSLGISSYLGVQFSYKWKSNIHFFIEPNVRIQHRGLTTKDYPISQKYTTVSFFTGAAYNF